MVSGDRLDRYASVLVGIALRIEPGDRLLIRSGTHATPLVHRVARAAYEAGAVNVDVLWVDDELDRARFTAGSRAAADELSYDYDVLARAAERSDSYLRIVGEAPNRLADVDSERVAAAAGRAAESMGRWMEKAMALDFFWTVAAAPSVDWAEMVFPDLAGEEAVDALWNAVLATARVDEPDPLSAWESHLDHLTARQTFLNERAYASVRYVGPGTDLVVGLSEMHRWNNPGEGAKGRRTVANIPTEEISTSPHSQRAEGIVRAARPLSYQGRLIEGFEFQFKDGAVVDARADRGQDDLDRILATDDGSRRLGEVALVPTTSLVSAQNLTWYETLFDENDASHLALGRAYPMGIRGGMEMTPQQLADVGNNASTVHVDFVVGARDVTIYGVTADGGEEPLIAGGEWTFEV
ncbi:MAG: aminopeptidase [Actinomycetota bacterium]